MNGNTLNLYHFEPKITTLGPGKRAGIWFQGCERNCPGCLVPESHQRKGGELWEVDALVSKIESQSDIEGISISGGEPLLQQEGLLIILQKLKQRRPDLSVVLFTGFLLSELQKPLEKRIIQHVDILVDGPFKIEKQIVGPWRGSENQQIHFLSNRYSGVEHQNCQSGIEFFIRSDGGFFMSGVPQPGFVKKLERLFSKHHISNQEVHL